MAARRWIREAIKRPGALARRGPRVAGRRRTATKHRWGGSATRRRR